MDQFIFKINECWKDNKAFVMKSSERGFEVFLEV